MHATTVRGDKLDASFWILHNVLRTVNEDLEGVVDVSSKIGSQAETHWQTVATMDDADIGHNISVHGSLDF